MNEKMSDRLVAPISDYSDTLSEIIHRADLATFRMQAAQQFGHNPAYRAKWKKEAKESLTELRKAVKALSEEVSAI